MTNINAYDEYGIPAATNVGRFGYTGQAWLPEIGLYHYKARIYSPTLGRFMQTDPIGYGDGINWYDYVGGDPVNGSDPSGMCPSCAIGALVEVGFQLYTGELQQAVSQARQGSFGALAVSAGKVGVSAVTGGIGGKAATAAAKAVSGAFKAAGVGRNAAGRFVANNRGKQAAQDIATQGAQERVVGSGISALGCLR